MCSKTFSRRGFYIYGRDFFFLPNKFWRIISDTDGIRIKLRGSPIRLKLPRKYLLPTLREPSECAYELKPKPSHYLLTIPQKPLQKLPQDLRKYVKTTDKLLKGKIPAKDYYQGPKSLWYNWAHHATLEPFGAIVIPEKFRPYQRGVAAHYLARNEDPDGQVGVPVSFYTRSAGSAIKNKAIVAWLNSTLGLAFRHRSRAWLGAASERMSGKQFDDRMSVIDVNSLSNRDLKRLANHIDKAPVLLPDIITQLEKAFKWRERLDYDIFSILGASEAQSTRWIEHCRTRVLGWAKTPDNL